MRKVEIQKMTKEVTRRRHQKKKKKNVVTEDSKKSDYQGLLQIRDGVNQKKQIEVMQLEERVKYYEELWQAIVNERLA